MIGLWEFYFGYGRSAVGLSQGGEDFKRKNIHFFDDFSRYACKQDQHGIYSISLLILKKEFV